MVLAAAVAAAISCTGPTSGPTPLQPGSQGLSTPSHVAREESENFSHFPTPVVGGNWRTNWERYILDPELLGPGNNRDAIPPIYLPQFEPVDSADSWLDDDDLVGVLALDDEVHVYPLRLLVYHEVANDQIAGVPVLVTFCPLCDTVLAFDRRVAGEALLFGVSMKLHNKNLIMWDHQTESWWQQASGMAIVGDLAGEQLDFLPVRTLFWRDVRQDMPQARVLSRESGFPDSEAGFYDIKMCPTDYATEPPLWTGGPTSEVLGPHDRVVGLNLKGAVAYPVTALAQRRVVNDVVDGQDVVLFHSAQPCTGGRGAATTDTASVYSPLAGERKLSFYPKEGKVLDRETGGTWSPGGLALSGPLKGTQLRPLPYTISFWFAWVAFYPNTDLRLNE